jgi:hypothetical protein
MYPTPPPPERQPERQPFLKTTTGVLTAAGTFIAAMAGLIGALTAAGIFDQGSTPTPVPQGTSNTIPTTLAEQPQSSSQQPSPSPAPIPSPSSNRASINLVYQDDSRGCALQLVVQVGSQSVEPTGNVYSMSNVETGVQQYAIGGVITCSITPGACYAQGTGSVDVAEGRTYYVTWQGTDDGCYVALTE